MELDTIINDLGIRPVQVRQIQVWNFSV